MSSWFTVEEHVLTHAGQIYSDANAPLYLVVEIVKMNVLG